MAARMPMMATTIINSISVNPLGARVEPADLNRENGCDKGCGCAEIMIFSFSDNALNKRQHRAATHGGLTVNPSRRAVIVPHSPWLARVWCAVSPRGGRGVAAGSTAWLRRTGALWRRVSYAEALSAARALGAALQRRGLSAARPVVVLSDNSIDHALLALACQYVGVPVAPISQAYSLMSKDHAKLKAIAAFAPVAQDIVVTGHDCIGFMIFPNLPACRKLSSDLPADALPEPVLAHEAVKALVHKGLQALRSDGGGSSTYATRALFLLEPPNIDAGEITDKGYLNQRAVLTRRAGAVARLHDAAPGPNVILL